MNRSQLQSTYDILKRDGEIKYGHRISRETLAAIFCVEPVNYESWDYIDPFLSFKSYLEQEYGMFCTTNQGDLCIAEINEAPEYSRRRRKRAESLDRRTKNILEKLDYGSMNSTARSESILEKRLLELKLRQSRLIRREVEKSIEYYEADEDNE